MRKPQSSTGQDEVLSDRIIQLLRERVLLPEQSELIEYLDCLIPEYEMPAGSKGTVVDKRLVYDWTEFLEFHGEDFIRNAYLCVFKREVDLSGLQSATHALNVEACSRVKLLGRLRYSGEGRRHAVEIKGLWIRFQLARLQKIPLFGALLSLVMNLTLFSHLESEVNAVGRGIRENKKKRASTEEAVSGHYNSVAEKLNVSKEKTSEYIPHGMRDDLSNGSPTLIELNRDAVDQRKTSSVLGFFMQLPRAIRFLSRVDKILENQQREISECDRDIVRMEIRLMQHYNDTLKHLKREVAETLKADITR